MSDIQDDASSGVVTNIWSRLMFGVAQKRKDLASGNDDEQLKLSAVERQTENSRKGGTIWEAVRKADEIAFKRLVNEDRNNADARGPVGECPVHMLFLYGTETHLHMARYLITNFPHTITQRTGDVILQNRPPLRNRFYPTYFLSTYRKSQFQSELFN